MSFISGMPPFASTSQSMSHVLVLFFVEESEAAFVASLLVSSGAEENDDDIDAEPAEQTARRIIKIARCTASVAFMIVAYASRSLLASNS